ncbi:regulator of chromosome condensation [Anaeramoeba flamelloides]|uniref:Regulator of chromosome condensation n=1 Tax=Anaeramoeba flamelloides TaxID=1746091 RepID=A0ABQ8XDW2_9EUKA|nr:regulator of chromosome condensation [Anaeramoeba flamelloides]
MSFCFGFGDNHKGLLGIRKHKEVQELLEVVVAPESTVKEVVSTRNTTIFLTIDGSLYHIQSATPNDVSLQKYECEEMVTLKAGNAHFITLSRLGRVYTWGSGAVGQLGHGNKSSQDNPKLVEYFNDKQALSVYACFSTTYVITEGNTLFGFGNGFYGELGNCKNYSSLKPVRIQSDVTKIYDGLGHHIFALYTNNEVKGWGLNEHGQLGNGQKKTQLSPTKIKFLTKKKNCEIHLGSNFTLALTGNGQLFVCGSGKNITMNKDLTQFKELPFFKKIKILKVTIGDDYTLVMDESKQIYGFGLKMENYPNSVNLIQRVPISLSKSANVQMMKAGQIYSIFIRMSVSSGFQSSREKIIEKEDNLSEDKEDSNSKNSSTDKNFNSSNNKENVIEEIEVKPQKLTQNERQKAILKLTMLTKNVDSNYKVDYDLQKREEELLQQKKQQIIEKEKQFQIRQERFNLAVKQFMENKKKNELLRKNNDLSFLQNNQNNLKSNENKNEDNDDKKMKILSKYLPQMLFHEKLDVIMKREKSIALTVQNFQNEQIEQSQQFDQLKQIEQIKENEIQRLRNDLKLLTNELDQIKLNFHQSKNNNTNNNQSNSNQEMQFNSKDWESIVQLSQDDINQRKLKIKILNETIDDFFQILSEKDKELKELKTMNQIFENCIQILQGELQKQEKELDKVKELIIRLSRK